MLRCNVTMRETDQNNEVKTKQRAFTLPSGLAEKKQEKERLLVSFEKILPDLSFVHFGYEERENTCGYKIYGEYGSNRKAISQMKDPFLIGLGFKWDVFQPERQVTTKYMCVPGLTQASMQARIEDTFQTQANAMLIDASKDILKQSLEKIPLNDVIYLEVADGNGPRRSFDINVYDAGLQMKHIHQPIRKIFQHFSIPDSIYDSIYNPKNEYLFGHISGGVDRNRKAFITIYGGLEKHQDKNAVNDIRRVKCGEYKI
ncbi:MAG: hypothetical protein KBA28_03035 [Syntrophaceae bacterium]|nr:hypothetical protein [Syntrophaceae bacterium]